MLLAMQVPEIPAGGRGFPLVLCNKRFCNWSRVTIGCEIVTNNASYLMTVVLESRSSNNIKHFISSFRLIHSSPFKWGSAPRK